MGAIEVLRKGLMFVKQYFKKSILTGAYRMEWSRNRLETIKQKTWLLKQGSHEVSQQLRLEVGASSGKKRSH